MPRLTKRDVEDLLRGDDEDPVGALTVALRRVLGLDLDFDALIDAAPLTQARREALHHREQHALDGLVTVLNEERHLAI